MSDISVKIVCIMDAYWGFAATCGLWTVGVLRLKVFWNHPLHFLITTSDLLLTEFAVNCSLTAAPTHKSAIRTQHSVKHRCNHRKSNSFLLARTQTFIVGDKTQNIVLQTFNEWTSTLLYCSATAQYLANAIKLQQKGLIHQPLSGHNNT